MHARLIRMLAATGSVSLLFGCAANQYVRDLSSETLIQVLEYQSSIQGMTRSLRAHYDSRLKGLTESAKIQESIGRVVYTTLAEDQTEKILDHGFRSSDLRSFLNEAMGERRAAEASYNAALMSLEAKHRAIASDIAFQESHLRTLQTKLEQLQSTESSRERIRQIIPLLQAARDAHRKPDTDNEAVSSGDSASGG